MATVAAESGQSESFVYWHFRNKDTLIARAVEYGYQKRRERGQTWIAAEPGPGRLNALQRNFAGPEGYELTEYEPWRLGLMLSLERRDSAALETFTVMRNETIERVRRWWIGSLDTSRIADPDGAAAFLTHLTLAAHDGHFLSRASRRPSVDRSPVLLAHALEAVARRLESGAVPPSPDAPSAIERRVPDEPTNVKQALLRAAAAEVTAHGPDGASVARICEVAGTPPTSLYWWFDDRSALIAASITEIHNDWRRVAPRADSIPDGGFTEVTEEFSRRWLTAMLLEPDLPRVLNMEALHHDRSTTEAHALLETIRVTSHMALAALFRRTLPADAQACADELASFAAAVADGLFVAAHVDRRYLALEQSAPAMAVMIEATLAAGLEDG